MARKNDEANLRSFMAEAQVGKMPPIVVSRQNHTDTPFPIRLSSIAFPLRAPCAITLAWLPVTVLTAAVDGYFEAFFACMCHEDLWGEK